MRRALPVSTLFLDSPYFFLGSLCLAPSGSTM